MGDGTATFPSSPQSARIITGGFRVPSQDANLSEATKRLSGHVRSARASQRRRFGALPGKVDGNDKATEVVKATSASVAEAPAKLGLWEKTEKRHLELNMTSLQEAYARKIAETEISCEKQLQEAEQSRNDWFKKKKVEIGKIRAGVVVMQALFERRKQRFLKQMQEDRDAFEKEQERMKRELAEAKAETVQIREESARQVSDLVKDRDKKMEECTTREVELTERATRAERAAERADKEKHRLLEVEKGLKMEVEDLQMRLRDAERAEELQRRTEQVEALEIELKRVRKMMVDRKHADAEELRKELMEYVKFIVRILPEEWRTKLRPELMQRLEQQAQPLEELPESASYKAMRDLNIAVGEWQLPSPTALPPLHGSRGFYGRSK
eukprot:TRINITY_DN75516_c0_g1_i1.p1 TRINITY_DN75516_c0_g1~~TRINITY_DN75516_c0_g1_i1.p1  ORF type:complete len:407 (-),score=102.26 TRINITY_DN75516_c0_g1_i1:58-1209(-)